MAASKRTLGRRRPVAAPARKKVPSRRERQVQDILALAEKIEREGVPEEEGPQKLSRWGLPANVTHSVHTYSKATGRLIDRHNALIDLKQDALDAYEARLIDRVTYEREAQRLKPLIEEAGREAREAMSGETSEKHSRRGSPPPARKRPTPRRRR